MAPHTQRWCRSTWLNAGCRSVCVRLLESCGVCGPGTYPACYILCCDAWACVCCVLHITDSGDSCEFGSSKYYALCGFGGILSCGITHTAVVPLDLVKCRLQVCITLRNKSLASCRWSLSILSRHEQESFICIRLLYLFFYITECWTINSDPFWVLCVLLKVVGFSSCLLTMWSFYWCQGNKPKPNFLLLSFWFACKSYFQPENMECTHYNQPFHRMKMTFRVSVCAQWAAPLIECLI